MALTYSQKNGIFTQSYDETELGITAGVTVVGATPFTKVLPWQNFRNIQGFLNYTLNGNQLVLAFKPVGVDLVTPFGNGIAYTLTGGTSTAWGYGPGYANNGQWDILGVGNGTFNNAGQFPLTATNFIEMSITRVAGAANSTLGTANLFLRS